MEEQKEREALKALIAGVMPGRENALVFGEGPQNPKLMLIGEAPGEQESLQGRPFVGKAGKNLDHFLELAGLAREEIYISNVVKSRPTKTGSTGRLSNRPDVYKRQDENTECFAFLAGHESFAAAEGAIKIALNANKVRTKPLRVILNGLGKDAAMIISRINGFT